MRNSFANISRRRDHVVAMELTEKQYVDRKVLVNTSPSNDRDDQNPGTQLFLEF